MVVFNCNACGEALKKNQVEKHTLRCRNCEVLSCVDCGKDFWGNDYQAHIKCITEDEKYCGKGYVPKINKGEVKQEQWIEKVQNAIEKSVTNPKLKGLLEQLKDYPNIPRKKTKFVNFLKNSMRINSDSLITQVWDTLMAAASQENGVQNGLQKTDKPVNELASPKVPDNDIQENGGTEERKKKVKKENKKGNVESTQEKKGEGKKRKLSEEDETVERAVVSHKVSKVEEQENDTQLCAESTEHKLSKRERKEERRKKANKKEKKDNSENSCSKEVKKGKKRKLSESEETVQGEIEVTENSNKKKKNKQASQSKEEDDDETNVENDEEIVEPKKSKKVKFNWHATILAVLESKGELSLKKLQKKVINEFSALDAANYSEDNLRAKFHRKVNKMAQVKVFKDRVKLK